MRKKYLLFALLTLLGMPCMSSGQSMQSTPPPPPAVTGEATPLTPTADTRPSETLSAEEQKMRAYFEALHHQNDADFSQYRESIVNKYKSVPQKDKQARPPKTP